MSKFIQKIKEAVIPTGYEVNRYGTKETNPKNSAYLEEMKSWVGGCVSSRADEVATINVKLYRWTKDKGVEEIHEHDILDLLYKVNDDTTKFDLFWLTEAYISLTGECPWLLEKSGKEIKNIYLLRPDKLRPTVGENRLIDGYKYRIDHTLEITIPKELLIFLKVPNPSNPFRGIGILQMAARTVDVDNYAEEWNKTFYENSAHPDSVLNVKVEQMTNEQKDKLKKSIREQYSGRENAHKLMVLFGEMSLNKLGNSQKDMDFLEQQRFDRDKILGLFKVPKAILSQTEGVNFASAKVAQYVFSKYTIKPQMERLVQQLNEFLLPMFPGTEDMFLDYDNPVPDDEELKAKIYEGALKSGYMTINEVRNANGLTDVEGGDVLRVPLNMGEIGGEKQIKEFKLGEAKKKVIAPNQEERIKQLKARSQTYFDIEEIKEEVMTSIKDVIREQILDKNKKHKSSNNLISNSKLKTLTEEEKLIFWQQKDAITNKYTPRLQEILVKIFKSQLAKVLSKLNEFKSFKLDSNAVYNSIKLDKDKEIKTTIELTWPELENIFKESADKAFEVSAKDMCMNVARKDIQEIIDRNSKLAIKNVTEYTNSRIKDIIVNGIGEGKSINQLTDDLKKFFHESEVFRAERIARTETVRYNTLASEQAYLDSGIVIQKEWFVNPGACQFCQPMNGKRVSLGKSFFDKGETVIGNEDGKLKLDYDTVLTPPLHPNCRCDLVPVFR